MKLLDQNINIYTAYYQEKIKPIFVNELSKWLFKWRRRSPRVSCPDMHPQKMTTGHPVGPRGQDTDHLHTNLRHLNQQKSVQILGKSVFHCPVTADYWCIKTLQCVNVFAFIHPVLQINNSLDTSPQKLFMSTFFFLDIKVQHWGKITENTINKDCITFYLRLINPVDPLIKNLID